MVDLPTGFRVINAPSQQRANALPDGFALVPQGQQQQNAPLINPNTGQPIPQITVTMQEPPMQEGGSNPLADAWNATGQFAQSTANAGMTFAENAIGGIPIAGPALQGAGDFITSEVGGRLMGQDPAAIRNELAANRDVRAQNQPVAAVTGALSGSIGALAPVGATQMGAHALGIAGQNLGTRMLASGTSGGIISGLDSAARGDNPDEIRNNTLIGGGVGAAIPGVGATIGAAGRAVGSRVGPLIGGIGNADNEAARRVFMAQRADIASGQPRIDSDLSQVAALNNQPVLNMDRGGEWTRGLMRSAANQSPDARALVQNVTQDRFQEQSARTVGFFNRVMGGDVDNLVRQAEIRAQASTANTAAYRAAMESPEAQIVWNADLQNLLQSDAVQRAIGDVGRRSSNLEAMSGNIAVRNPFVRADDGTFNVGSMGPDGPTVYPNLAFWDQVKRNLDGQIGMAYRGGDNGLGNDLTALKRHLVGVLDNQVPSYANARSTAASFFGADDALGAGRQAWVSPKAIDESRQAFNALSEAEQRDFGIGLVSQIMDDVRNVNNRSNLARYFDTPARKELMQMALGSGRANQFEAFIRVENIMDLARNSLGNSTTARQLQEMGLAGAAGGAAGLLSSGGDWSQAGMWAALTSAGRAGAGALGRNVDNAVLQRIATLLASGDEQALNRAIANAALSQQNMQAIEAIQQGLAISARGSMLTAIAQQ